MPPDTAPRPDGPHVPNDQGASSVARPRTPSHADRRDLEACRERSDHSSPTRSGLRGAWQTSLRWIRSFAHHPDPLAEASNWVAILIGTHLPLWPLYVWWSAGAQAMPTALWTAGLTPVFLAIPLLARRSGLWGRIATPLAGIANTVFTLWILGGNTGTTLFLAPCTALAAILFRRRERWLMIGMTILPLAVFYALRHVTLVPLHRYDAESAKALFTLNLISVSVIATAFGWLQADIYRRMEPAAGSTDDGH